MEKSLQEKGQKRSQAFEFPRTLHKLTTVAVFLPWRGSWVLGRAGPESLICTCPTAS